MLCAELQVGCLFSRQVDHVLGDVLYREESEIIVDPRRGSGTTSKSCDEVVG
jgi:hypothetical protein